MSAPQFKHIYGPVYSWRIGRSLGIDPLSGNIKFCNYDCNYCQLGSAEQLSGRQVFVPVESILAEIRALPADCQIDYYTFSGSGEPTLAANLGEMIRAVKALKPGGQNKVAVITNSSSIIKPEVQADLRLADLILFKIDAPNQEIFEQVNRPVEGLKLADIVGSIKLFRKSFTGRLALQIMFTDDNREYAAELAAIARDIAPDEVQLNTPLRPSPVRPLAADDMAQIKRVFVAAGLRVLSVYEEEKKAYEPFNNIATEKRHGKFKGN
ncbi:MAG: radical SAM protein [Candidatus Omnitrophica bacterium]|nr:radical SAM protein [Candidatus Omnitrophota bacterium]